MFKEYQNKSSLNRGKSRIVQGGTAIPNGIGIGWIERRNINNLDDEDETNFTIRDVHLNRFDLLAHMFYGSAEFEWVILQYNNIVDYADVSIGDVIKIPSSAYVRTMIANKASVL